MNTIKDISTNGLQLNNGRWLTCDRFKILSKPLFKNLKIGDKVDNLEFNGKNYLVSFTVIPHGDIGVKENSPLVKSSIQLSSLKSSPSPINVPISLGSDVLERGKQVLNPQVNSTNSVQDSIRYAQCVNIAFNSFAQDGTNLLYQRYE
jgi:hypothetical protein